MTDLNMASEAQIRVDRLDDGSYIVTKKRVYAGDRSESCQTEGEMVEAVLEAIMRGEHARGCQRRREIAEMASVSLDKAIGDWDAHHRGER